MILFIDTTDLDRAVIKILGSEKPVTLSWQGKQLSQSILLQLKKLFNRIGIKNITGIVVVRGPGPFSRTRTGVVVANALAWSLQLPVVGIKKNESISNLSKLFLKKTKKLVLPFYDRPPNITRPKA